jgi:hypothetical protein
MGSSAAYSLRQLYQKYLLGFEEHRRALETPPPPSKKAKKGKAKGAKKEREEEELAEADAAGILSLLGAYAGGSGGDGHAAVEDPPNKRRKTVCMLALLCFNVPRVL